MKVALFVTCLVDGVTPSVGKATVAMLERLGVRVEVPMAQTCCGQMHINTGYAGLAAPLAAAFADAFAGYDHVVTPSGSCAGAVRHQHPQLTGQPAPPVLELSEFLVDVLGVEDVGARYPHRVTYHPTCHSLRMLRVGDRPLRLLRNVRDLELVELPGAESCCGFGGTFAVKNVDVSEAMLADKTAAIRSTGASVCTAGDASCLLHIGGGLLKQRAGVAAVHLAEILAST
ncbi:MAG: (Fe-S)-binding protein [Mycobacteriales bacterium]